ncbi:Uncharacterized OsmC-related protein [Pelagirhabdus alkalitolerans]|uniref:Uncharacterized OsmC-related protein n=1 Tax=Pelagirhabdus alkalitolerans TaxID=1612202 RepID=A0A1G6GL55_9BACI|nr:OsmC family protein [Pelagirhabdus alkalitolerans]SDB82664.1 Uncharacterized OsmC-related protein [Pelagirhabdus alkalitolerans]
MQKMKFNVKAENEGLAITAKTGKHEVVLDEGSQMGGKDSGPNPMQNTLASLSSCENVTAHIAAKEMKFDLQGLSFDISGSFDPRGFMGDPNVRPYFEEVTVNVKVTTSESDERIKELQEKVESRCPVYTMFKAAGVEMNDTWTKA